MILLIKELWHLENHDGKMVLNSRIPEYLLEIWDVRACGTRRCDASQTWSYVRERTPFRLVRKDSMGPYLSSCRSELLEIYNGFDVA